MLKTITPPWTIHIPAEGRTLPIDYPTPDRDGAVAAYLKESKRKTLPRGARLEWNPGPDGEYYVEPRVIERTNQLLGSKLTALDFAHWLEGGPGYGKMDSAVRKILGRGLFQAGEDCARLPDLFCAFMLHRARVPKVVHVDAGGKFEFLNLDRRPNR